MDENDVDETDPPPLKKSRDSLEGEGEDGHTVEQVSEALDAALSKAERKRKKKEYQAAKKV